jgi:TATA-box binding protein (TBP) (component of TFIID and TFIIIB)
MNPADLKIGPLRISTMVVTAHIGTEINLMRLLELFHEKAIPLTWPAEGFLKVEYKPILNMKPNATPQEEQKAKQLAKSTDKIVIGTCMRDELTKRKKSKNIFFNQSTLVVRRKFNENSFKEVNIKLFKNGGIQMTGIPSDAFAKDTLQWLAQELSSFSTSVLEGKANPNRYSIQLINSDYQINGSINRERLHEILINEYNLFSSFESTIYQGCDTKYYYNEAAPEDAPEGICPCQDTICNGSGDGTRIGQCKEITISPFHTGSVIITGARKFEQIEKAYVFINKILVKHCSEIIKPFPPPVAKEKKVKEPKPVKEKKVKEPKEKEPKEKKVKVRKSKKNDS